jgi:hypothetical protein
VSRLPANLCGGSALHKTENPPRGDFLLYVTSYVLPSRLSQNFPRLPACRRSLRQAGAPFSEWLKF